MKGTVEMRMTIADIQDAVEFWLEHRVLRRGMQVEGVSFSAQTHQFTIKLTPADESEDLREHGA